MVVINDGWFSEICPMWPGRALSIEIDHEIYHRRSQFQDVALYQTKHCGKMLALDGIIQFTENDEFAYQEMIAHPALFSHPCPERVLVIGGGDGGVVREVAKHSCVKEIDLCEIDGDVIEVCRQHVPSLACGFDDPRVKIHVQDGNVFIKDRQNYYDVIIVDSSDPVGPAEALFGEEFYRGMRTALNDTGIIAAQGESFFLHPDIFQSMIGIAKRLFPIWSYSYMLIPTYPGGSICICLGSKKYPLDRPQRLPDVAMQKKLDYYTPEIHYASTVMPAFVCRLMDAVKD